MKQKIVLLDIDRTIFDTERKYIYRDVEGAIHQLSKISLIGIFSQGIDGFQRAKLSTVKHLLEEEHIHIDLEKIPLLPNVMAKYKGKVIFIVDDTIEMLKKAKEMNPSVFTILIKRNGRDSGKSHVVFTPDFIVQDLKGVIPIVKEINEKT